MDGNNGKKLRNLLLYIGIPVVVLFIIIFLFSNRMPRGETYKYSDILNYFETGQVKEYTLNLGTGEMTLRLNDKTGTVVGYVVPSVDLFYRNAAGYIEEYNQAHPDEKMVQDISRPGSQDRKSVV